MSKLDREKQELKRRMLQGSRPSTTSQVSSDQKHQLLQNIVLLESSSDDCSSSFDQETEEEKDYSGTFIHDFTEPSIASQAETELRTQKTTNRPAKTSILNLRGIDNAQASSTINQQQIKVRIVLSDHCCAFSQDGYGNSSHEKKEQSLKPIIQITRPPGEYFAQDFVNALNPAEN